MHRRGKHRSGDARGATTGTWFYAPLPNYSIQECEKYTHGKSSWLDSCHMQMDCATNTSSQVRIKKKNICPSLVTRYTTTARHLNVMKRMCKGTKFCMALLARKKWSKFQNVRWRSSQKTWHVLNSDRTRPVRTSSQEPVLGISLIPRTGCWLKSGVLNFFPWTPFTHNLFWQTSHRPVNNFS